MSFLRYEWYNEFSNFNYVFQVIGYFLLLFGAIVFHEIGHWLYFKRIGKKMKVHFIYESILKMRLETGEQKDYDDMSDDDYLCSLWWGVLAGVVPIIISSIFFFPTLLMVVPYGVGCWSDLKEINKVYRSRGQGFLNMGDEIG